MTLGEFLIGAGTLALAVATVWLASEARKARLQADEAVRRRLLRSALAELLDDLRVWTSANPARGQPALEQLRHAEPALEALGRLVDEVDLPGDVAIYLVWLTGRIREESAWWSTVIAVAPGDPDPAAHPPDSGVGKWSLLVDRLQVAAALVAGEAARRGYPEIRQLHDAAPWTVVLPGPPRERELRHLTAVTMLGSPAFPAGADFTATSPEARDRAGAATAARQQEDLAAAVGVRVGQGGCPA